jgi:hypothetical protein
MFRASPASSQIDLLSHIEQFLRQRDQEKLNDPIAWHNVFLDQVTKRIPEERFSLLFDEENGRPNAPIRVLVAMLILKEGFGWSDEQLFEAIHFNLLVRRALGFLNLTDEAPVESTYYLFKQRLYAHQLETGVNLLHEVFQELTGDQAKRLGVVGEKLRMDSTLLDSNLATCTRLQLIIACLQVFWKSLSDEQKSWLDEADRALLDGLCAKRASQLIYGMEETTKKARLEEFGELLVRLHRSYSAQSSDRYDLIERLLLEQYQLDGEGQAQRVVLKPACEISADSLQSPHDEEAAYRKKKDETVRGYSTNVTETCEEELNLIVDVQTEPASTADNTYLKEAVDNSEAVLGNPAREVSVDGAYYSEENERYAEEQDKDIHYTGFPGKKGRYEYERTEAGVVVTDSDRGETQRAEEYKPGRYRFRVDGKWRYITDQDIEAAACRRRTETLPRELFNRRCNVEATIFQLCYHTRKKKLKYRGKFRVQLWAICRAAWINMRRIANYQANQAEASA